MKEEDKKKEEENDDLYKRGKAAGVGTTIMGSALLAAGNLEKLDRYRKYAAKKLGEEELKNLSKKAKYAGGIAIPAGIALTGYSHYKSKKAKNKNDNP